MELKGLVDPEKKAEVLKALKEGRGKEIFKGKVPDAKPEEKPLQKPQLLPEGQQRLNYELCKAAALGRDVAEDIERLLRAGADVNARDVNEETALIHSSRIGDVGVVELLILNGADVNAKDSMGETPLIRASVHGRAGVVELLISKGADVNARSHGGLTALGAANAYHQSKVAEILMRAGAVE